MNEGGETKSTLVPVLLGAVTLLVIGGGLWYVSPLSSGLRGVDTTIVYDSGTRNEGSRSISIPSEVVDSASPVSSEPSPVIEIPLPENEGVTTEVIPLPTETPPKPSPVADPVPTEVTPPPVILPPTSQSSYKDGTYTAVGQYHTPAGTENVEITLTLKDGLIVDASGANRARDRKSQKYVDMFLGGFKTLVVGKKISEVSLGKVSGASLTPKGFNAAVLKIRSEATV